MSESPVLIHGTAVAIGNKAALLTGPSGAGKSDLGLRFVTSEFLWSGVRYVPQLVGDDQLLLSNENGRVSVRPPETLAGLLEVRGVGIVKVSHIEMATLCLVVKLCGEEGVPRLPDDPLPSTELCGIQLPSVALWPFDVSAPHKLFLALLNASGIVDVLAPES